METVKRNTLFTILTIDRYTHFITTAENKTFSVLRVIVLVYERKFGPTVYICYVYCICIVFGRRMCEFVFFKFR